MKLNPEKDSYKEGDVVTATAAAKEGYKFVNWTVDGKAVSDKAEFTFKVDRTLTLKANFEKAAENPNQEDPKDDDNRSFRSQDWRWQQALLWQLLERKKTDAVQVIGYR